MNNDTARDQAQAQMNSIRTVVAALACDYERLDELREERDTFVVGSPDGNETAAPAQWAAENPEDAEELAELESQADGCNNWDDAEQRIQEDALSVEVRTDWYAPHNDGQGPVEFRIVLCTGGPHVQIVGELEDGQPSRAWLEYQDWGTPMTERCNQPGDMADLLAYASCFYYGE